MNRAVSAIAIGGGSPTLVVTRLATSLWGRW